MTKLVLLSVFPALMAYAAASDFMTMTIPNRIALALVAAFPLVAVAAGLGWHAMALHLGAGALVLAVCFGFFAMGWIGGGDAKLAAAVALWFGFGVLLEYVLLASIYGAVLTLAVIALRTQVMPRFTLGWRFLDTIQDRTKGIPYGIALALAALVVYPRSPLYLAITSG
jgi:prepilin peptidase CpaA